MSKTFAVVNGSVVMGADGQPETIEGYDKINQDINDVLLTPFNADRNYGNELLSDSVILAERSAIPGLVQRDVTAAIGRLKTYQGQLAREQLPPSEKIDRLKAVNVTSLGNLGVAFLAVVAVVSRTSAEVRKVFRISNSHLDQ